MRLLIIGPDITDKRKVKNFTGVQAYYLTRELRARGVELAFVDGKNDTPLQQLADLSGRDADHVLAYGLRWFTHKPPGCATILKTKTPGAVTQLHDGLVHEHLADHMVGVDCTFIFRDDSTRTRDWERYAKNYHYIGWAADPEVLFPAQHRKELRVLLDHPYYHASAAQIDLTPAVTQDAILFAHAGKWRDRYDRVLVRRLVNGGAETVTLANVVAKSFDRKHVPFEDIAREYRQAHIFLPTHKESVGLTCLELAYCGALVVASRGLIYQDRLDTIRHISYEGTRAPWGQVLDAIDIEASAKMAREQSWGKVVDRMLQWFANYNK